MKRTAGQAGLTDEQRDALTMHNAIPAAVLDDLPPEVLAEIAKILGDSRDPAFFSLRVMSRNWKAIIEELVTAPVRRCRSEALALLQRIDLVQPDPEIRRRYGEKRQELIALLTEKSSAGLLRQTSTSTGIVFFTKEEIAAILRGLQVWNLHDDMPSSYKRIFLLTQGPAKAAGCYAAWNIVSALVHLFFMRLRLEEDDMRADFEDFPIYKAVNRASRLWAMKDPLEPMVLLVGPEPAKGNQWGSPFDDAINCVQDLLHFGAIALIFRKVAVQTTQDDVLASVGPRRFMDEAWHLFEDCRSAERAVWQFWFGWPYENIEEPSANEVARLPDLASVLVDRSRPYDRTDVIEAEESDESDESASYEFLEHSNYYAIATRKSLFLTNDAFVRAEEVFGDY